MSVYEIQHSYKNLASYSGYVITKHLLLEGLTTCTYRLQPLRGYTHSTIFFSPLCLLHNFGYALPWLHYSHSLDMPQLCYLWGLVLCTNIYFPKVEVTFSYGYDHILALLWLLPLHGYVVFTIRFSLNVFLPHYGLLGYVPSTT